MGARVIELGRAKQSNHLTVVTVAIGATGQAQLTVKTDMLDGPGYADMLSRFVDDQEALADRHARGFRE